MGTLVCWDRRWLRGLARALLRAHAVLDVIRHFRRLPGPPDLLFNDFLFALKVGEELDNPLRRRITDKVHVKDYICQRIGPDRTVPTLAVFETPAAVLNFRPDHYPVAVKPTHSSGRFLRIGSDAEWQAATPRMTGWLKHDFFSQSLERNYRGLAKRVMVEPWLDEGLRLEGSVHCRAGVPKVVSLIERYSKARQSYGTDRQPLGVSLAYPPARIDLDDWTFFAPLLRDAARLSADLSYIRVDFYTDGRRVVFGEMTNLPAGGRGRFYPAEGERNFSAAFFAPPP